MTLSGNKDGTVTLEDLLEIGVATVDTEGRITGVGLPMLNVKAPLFGAKGDLTHFTSTGTNINDGAITTGTALLTCATTTPFALADVGKVVSLPGAGAAGVTLQTTIAAFIDAGNVTLADNAATTVSGATVTYGTDDTLAVQRAINAAGGGGVTANQGAVVFFPQGRYLVSGLTMSAAGIQLLGCSLGDTASGGSGAMIVGRSTMSATTDLVSVTGAKCAIRNLTLSGNANGRDVLRLSNAASRFVGDTLYIQSAGVGCGITHGTSVTSLTNKWSNIYVSGCGSHGIVVNSSDTEWSNVTTFSNTGDGFRCVGTAGAVVNLHTWGNTGIGLDFVSGGNGWRVTNLYSETNTSDGVAFSTAIYNTIVNGVIRANGGRGVNVLSSSKRTTLGQLKVYNNAAEGVYVQSGDSCQLTDLDCFDDQGGKTQTYGIRIAAGVVGTSLNGKIPVIADNLTGGLLDAGTATIVNGAVIIVKAADQSVTSSAAVVNDNDFAIAMGAGEVWEIEGVLFVDGAQTGDFNIRMNTPSVGSGFWQALGPSVSSASTSADNVMPLGQAYNTTQTLGMLGTGVITPVIVKGVITVGATPGTFNVKWAQGTSDATATVVHAGSFLRFMRLK